MMPPGTSARVSKDVPGISSGSWSANPHKAYRRHGEDCLTLERLHPAYQEEPTRAFARDFLDFNGGDWWRRL